MAASDPVLFVSDLHLHPGRPDLLDAWHAFLGGPARRAVALYILGDLFDAWAGDDDLDEHFNVRVTAPLAACAGAGVALYVLHGNRDFLLGEAFANRVSASMLPDPSVLGTQPWRSRTLISHGDALCTDDVDYQQFRDLTRSSGWQSSFLGRPLAERKAEIAAMRNRSESAKSRKAAEIMDVNAVAVAGLMRANGYPRVIHGHTHRPGMYLHEVDGRCCERWVLPDWIDSARYVRLVADRPEFDELR
jgi:UDP-2,3-diacylglucosamine hydrolase